MNLPGRLRTTTLGDLLGALHRASASGILELVEGNGAARAHRVYLDQGMVDGVETALPAPRLGEILSGAGALSREGLLRLTRRLLAEPHRRSGEILLEDQLASSAAVKSGLRRQLRLRLEALFKLPEASIRFHVRRPKARAELGADALGPRDFLHDRPRARQRRAAGSDAQHSARARALRALELPPGASAEEAQRAFRRLAFAAHPDRHPEASAEERKQLLKRFAELSAAYHALTR